MKIKSKLILAATSLLVLSGVAAGTSTYAWYTANRQVELGITNIAAQAQLTTLSMSYDYTENTRNGTDAAGTGGTDPFVVDAGSETSAIVGSFTKTLTDVSSNGNGSYLKPIFGANVADEEVGFWAHETEYVASQNADNDVFYHELVFTFTLTGSEPTVLYLSPNSTVTENLSADDDDLAVADAVRFSVFSIDESDVKTEMIYANPNGDSESTYLADTTDITNDTVSGTFGILEQSVFFAKSGNYTEAELFYGAGDGGSLTKYNATSTGYVTEVVDATAGVTFNVAVDIWIEGTDADCVEDIDDEDYYGLFDVNLEFYSLNKDGMTDSGDGV